MGRGIDEIIRQAIERGEFDDLPGRGQPLDLSENPHADPEWHLAYRMLKESGFSLPWIEARQEIEKNLAQAREALARSWGWRQEQGAAGNTPLWVEEDWRKAQAVFHSAIEALNKKIHTYNLQTPSPRFQRALVAVEREIERVKNPTEPYR